MECHLVKLKNEFLKKASIEIKLWRAILLKLLITIISASPLILISNNKYQAFATMYVCSALFLVSLINRYAFIILAALLMIISSVNYHLIAEWGEDSISSRIQAAYLSPSYEVNEYIESFIGIREYTMAFSFLILMALGLYYIIKFNFKFKAFRLLSVIGLVPIVMLHDNFWFINNTHPKKITNALFEAREWKSVVNERLEYLSSIKSNSSKRLDNFIYDNIVIIMGESVIRSRMSVYGYNLPTTPFLNEFIKSKYAYVFDNAISPANQTRFSLPLMLTSADVESFDLFKKSKSIVTSFKDYGYKTHWFSNQFMSGAHDSYISTIASEADETKIANFSYVTGGKTQTKYDDVLIEFLEKIDISNDNKGFFVLHMLGSHFQYDRRYPSGFGIFTNPVDKTQSYDNSLVYGDLIISNIHKFFERKKTLWIFTSDHGQVVNKSKNGHGFNNPSYKDEFEVPLIIFSSVYNPWLDNFYHKTKDTKS